MSGKKNYKSVFTATGMILGLLNPVLGPPIQGQSVEYLKISRNKVRVGGSSSGDSAIEPGKTARGYFLSFSSQGYYFLQGFLESRSGGSENSEKDESSQSYNRYLSAEFHSPHFQIYGGRRFLPGPQGSFLLEPDFIGDGENIPHGRNQGSAFLFFPGLYSGLFSLEKNSGTGVFLSDENRRFLAAYHPKSRLGTLNLNLALKINGLRASIYTDIQSNERTLQGFASLRLEQGDASILILEARRNERWDYDSFPEREVFPGRMNRSGLGSLRAQFTPAWHLLLAGQDIYDQGLRFAEFGFSPAFGFLSGRFLFALRAYGRRTYGAPPEEVQFREAYSAGLGVRLELEKLFLRVFLEKRRDGPAGLELALGLSSPDLRFSFGLFMREAGSEQDVAFQFQLSNPQFYSGAKFHRDVRHGFQLKFRGKGLIFSVYASNQNKKWRNFMRLGFHVEL